jgi:hypothetical protein
VLGRGVDANANGGEHPLASRKERGMAGRGDQGRVSGHLGHEERKEEEEREEDSDAEEERARADETSFGAASREHAAGEALG